MLRIALLLSFSFFSSLCWAGQTAYVAGGFYPADPEALRKQVSDFLDGSHDEMPPAKDPRILIVPHAAYAYSGPVAGKAFRAVRGKGYPVVIVLGVAHRIPIVGAAIDAGGHFETPLGPVEIDQETAERLLGLSDHIHELPRAFRGEHSLEVELPFLQVALSDFKLVPILMTVPDLNAARSVGAAIATVMGENEAGGKRTLLVVSTDFAHYPKAPDARASDDVMLEQIAQVNAEGLRTASKNQIAKGVAGLGTTMCGEAGVLAALEAAKTLGFSESHLFGRATSADSPGGDPERAVGYAALAFYGAVAKLDPAAHPGLSREGVLASSQEEDLLRLARDSVNRFVRDGKEVKPTLDSPPIFTQPMPLFVTIKNNGKLRGCMGTVAPTLPLAQAVAHYALLAATKDQRFPPVTPDELDHLSYEISVLLKPRRILVPGQIRWGVDGVILLHGKQSGLLLPQVWQETGWTHEQFLSELARQKAGLDPSAWRDPSSKLFAFTAETFQDEPSKDAARQHD